MATMNTVNETAERLIKHPETIRGYCRRYPGRFAIHVGGHWRIPEPVLEQVLTGTPIEELPPLRTRAA